MMSHLQYNEPPPLLAADFGRMPFDALAVNHGAGGQGRHEHKKGGGASGASGGGMKRHELQNLLTSALQEVDAKARNWDLAVELLENRFHALVYASGEERETLQVKMAEVRTKLNAVAEAIDHNLVLTPKLASATQQILRAKQDPDQALDHCAAARVILENLPRGGTLPPNQHLPDSVIDMLHDAGRSDVVARHAQPTAALLAICYAYTGDAWKAAGKFDDAATAYFEALELVKEEEGADHPAAQDLVKAHHTCMQIKIDSSPSAADAPAPTTPRSSSSRRHFIPFTPPPARSALELDSEFARGAVTPGTGQHWDSVTPNYLGGFSRPWLPQEVTPSPAPVAVAVRPKIVRECYHCGSVQNLKLCSKCKKVCFCSVECQTQAWEKKHSEECQEYVQQPIGTTTA